MTIIIENKVMLSSAIVVGKLKSFTMTQSEILIPNYVASRSDPNYANSGEANVVLYYKKMIIEVEDVLKGKELLKSKEISAMAIEYDFSLAGDKFPKSHSKLKKLMTKNNKEHQLKVEKENKDLKSGRAIYLLKKDVKTWDSNVEKTDFWASEAYPIERLDEFKKMVKNIK